MKTGWVLQIFWSDGESCIVYSFLIVVDDLGLDVEGILEAETNIKVHTNSIIVGGCLDVLFHTNAEGKLALGAYMRTLGIHSHR